MPQTQADVGFEAAEKVLVTPAAGQPMAWLWSKPYHNKGNESVLSPLVLPPLHRVGGNDCT